MTQSKFSNDQIAALIQEITKEVLEAVSEHQELDNRSVTEGIAAKEERRFRRRKSAFSGQLHMKVLPEDEDWFRSLRHELEIQNGKLFHLLRRCFEECGTDTATRLRTADQTSKL